MGRVIPFPPCQFFEVHGSKFKLHPFCHLGQASVLCITHRVFFFGIRKDTFNGLFPLPVKFLVLRCIAGVICQVLVILPDMPLHCLYTVFGAGTQFSGRTVRANIRITFVFPVTIPVRGAVFQYLVFGANDAIVERMPSKHGALYPWAVDLPITKRQPVFCRQPFSRGFHGFCGVQYVLL